MIWIDFVPHIPKGARYTIGARIENKFLDLLELGYVTYFSKKENKIEKISECIFLLDTLKFIVSVAWDAKLLSNQQFEDVALKLAEIGRMLWGWKDKLEKLEKKNRIIEQCGKENTFEGGKQTDCRDSTCSSDSSNCC